MIHINQFINSNDKENLWHMTDPTIKQTIIKQLFKNKTDHHVKLGRILLEFIIQDDKTGKRDVHANYANLLCILLAKSHNPEFIKDIIQAKRCGNLFFHIDSTLLFEFSPKLNRETCVRDTVEYVNNVDNVDQIRKKKWFKVYAEWVNQYSGHYDETLVIRYWNKYKEPNYCENF